MRAASSFLAVKPACANALSASAVTAVGAAVEGFAWSVALATPPSIQPPLGPCDFRRNARPLVMDTLAAAKRSASIGTSSARSAMRSTTGSGWITRAGTLGSPSVVIFAVFTRASVGAVAGASTAARTASGTSFCRASPTGFAWSLGASTSILA